MTNVEVIRRFWEVWRDGGGAGLLERYDEFFTEAAEWCPPTREMTGMHYVGRHGIEQYLAWASYDPEAARRAETAIVNREPLYV